MNIFFTASFFGKKYYQKYYNQIIIELEKLGVKVDGTEKGNYITNLPQSIRNKIKDDLSLHYEAIRYGINNADAVIIECSKPGIRLGHEATLAILAKKHVLCLALKVDYSATIKNNYFHGEKYNLHNLKYILEEFVQIVQEEKLQNRFNMYISDRQLKHIQEKGKLLGLNSSEYLRKLIEEDML